MGDGSGGDDGHGGDDGVPAEAERSSAIDLAIDRLVMGHHEQATATVVVALREAGLDPIVLKGLSVQRRLYPDEVRTSTDIDLLLAPGQVRAGERALAALGYERFGVAGHASAWEAAGRVPVDLHRTLPGCAASPTRVWRTLAEHRTTVDIDGTEVAVLDGPALAVHLAIHLTQTATERQVDDLARAVAGLSDEEWTVAATIARALGVEAALAWALGEVPGGAARRRALGLSPVERDQLPPRKPREAGIARFVRSPVHWRDRLVELGNTARWAASPRGQSSWAAAHDRGVLRAPVGSARALAQRTWHHLVRRARPLR
jgi:hypothetical protein